MRRLVSSFLVVIFCFLGASRAFGICNDELALIRGNATFRQLAERVIGSSLDGRSSAEGESPRLTLTARDVEALFRDADDPWVQRMGRYLAQGILAGRISVALVGNKKDTDYAAGTCWHGGCGQHDILVLLDRHLMGSSPERYGLRAAARATLIHEAMHARINDYLHAWLERQGLDPALWHRRLDTATEEFLARLADQRALGRTGFSAGVRAWFDALINGGTLVNPWRDLESAWTAKLREHGIRPEDRAERVAALAEQRQREQEQLVRNREAALREVRGLSSLAPIRARLIREGRITATQWSRFEEAVADEVATRRGQYVIAHVAREVERLAPAHLGVTLRGDYSTNTIYAFEIGESAGG